MQHRVKRLIAAAAIAAAVGAVRGATDAAPSTSRVVYVSAVDKNGAPVAGLEAADFQVKEGGSVQRIALAPATAPLRIAVLVADWGTGNFQGGLATFMDTLLGRAEFALTSVLPQP